MKICLTGDDAAPHEPFILNLRVADGFCARRQAFFSEVFDWVEDLDRLGECVKGKWEEGPYKRRYFEYRIALKVPLNRKRSSILSRSERNGKVVYHNSWVTDFSDGGECSSRLLASGRSQWKIENEQFNVHKNPRL
ncbi:MAG: hypothetical protein KIT57_22835 [Blastocatellales bacterium]|nr:hypothetical protein [Blastocatellales bacterium]